ncbi:uncharacterized protein BJ171DRAFT_421320 [Polychytrium aggregatum]|uniref:uncharacterized protein n=1 Tax=Polychytrium aggregatum TaxID=110093 RepID=UPI0022FDF14A|nr:uncharacterized protein BJ171DRAFT_421320 [Polychytrium aggregatum]KAI9207021.1 hypothetical protein BJ171DRAFT_421320 [Polychytrium aggregatum]
MTGRPRFDLVHHPHKRGLSPASHQLDFHCANGTAQLTTFCSLAELAANRALSRITAAIRFRRPIQVTFNITSFCANSTSADPSHCLQSSKTLGLASPTKWYSWDHHTTDTVAAGIDVDYVYPSALAKQLLAQDPGGPANDGDIAAVFNSDCNWLMKDHDGRIYRSLALLNRTNQAGTCSDSTVSYDLEQIVLHELIHGLGFLSSWYPWLGNASVLLPSQPIMSSNHAAYIGLTKPYIFNKWMATVDGQWLRRYELAILRASDAAAQTSAGPDRTSETWMDAFMASPGRVLAEKMMSNYGTRPGRLVVWFNDTETRRGRYARLFASSQFLDGSTLSHIDASSYQGTAEFLMRPYATGNVLLDDYIPRGRRGPIGRIALSILATMGYPIAM